MDTIEKIYGNRIRNRAVGICIENQKILLVKHRNLGNPYFWNPVGGGIEFGETAQNALKREFLEETGLEIEVKNLLFVCQFIQKPLHALEFFFEVNIIGGSLVKGVNAENEFIEEVAWLSEKEILSEKNTCKHQIFDKINYLSDIYTLKGIF